MTLYVVAIIVLEAEAWDILSIEKKPLDKMDHVPRVVPTLAFHQYDYSRPIRQRSSEAIRIALLRMLGCSGWLRGCSKVRPGGFRKVVGPKFSD